MEFCILIGFFLYYFFVVESCIYLFHFLILLYYIHSLFSISVVFPHFDTFINHTFLIHHSIFVDTMEKELEGIVEEEIDEEQINKLYDANNAEKLTLFDNFYYIELQNQSQRKWEPSRRWV